MIKQTRRPVRCLTALQLGQEKPTAFCVITSVVFTTPRVVLTFRDPVTLSGTPKIETNTGKLPVSAERTGPDEVTLTYDAPGAVTSLTIPPRDPAIRNGTGGYLPPGTFPIAAG